MRPSIYSRVQTIIDIKSEFSDTVIPKGSMGTIIEIYNDPEEYAVDVEIPDANLVGNWRFDNIILKREQFIVIDIKP